MTVSKSTIHWEGTVQNRVPKYSVYFLFDKKSAFQNRLVVKTENKQTLYLFEKRSCLTKRNTKMRILFPIYFP